MSNDFSPREIVSELDKHIVGQQDAKRAVAIALRNRWRRLQLPEGLREEVLPKNILMIGPTGCGKTEIARRLAKLANAPFLKVEATKFTEVGYVGRDVEQIARDLMEAAIDMTRERLRKDVRAKAELAAEDRVLDALCGPNASEETRLRFRHKLRAGELNDREIEVEVADAGAPMQFEVPGQPGASVGMINIGDMLGKAFGGRTKKRKMTVAESHDALMREGKRQTPRSGARRPRGPRICRAERHRVHRRDRQDHRSQRIPRRRRREPRGRAARSPASDRGHDGEHQARSRKDRPRAVHLFGRLPHGQALRHAAGAAGRLPIRVSLASLGKDDFRRILTEPEASLVKQYKALLATEKVDLDFKDEAIDELARLSAEINETVENIGARRLHTVMEKLLEEISFSASDKPGHRIEIDAAYVRSHVSELAKNTDLSKFVL